MPVLVDAESLAVGPKPADAVYLGDKLKWLGEINSDKIPSLAAHYDAERVFGETLIEDNFNRADAEITEDGLVLAGPSVNYVRTPDTPVLDITGDLSIAVDFVIDTLPPANHVLVNKWLPTTGNRAYSLWINASGDVQLLLSFDGINTTFCNGPRLSNLGYSLGDRVKLKVEWDLQEGRGYWYDKPEDEWVYRLQHTPAGAAGLSIFTTTQPLDVGVMTGSSYGFDGTIYSVEVWNGRESGEATLAASPDFSAQAPGTTTFADAQGNIWTVYDSTPLGSAPGPGDPVAWGVVSGTWTISNNKVIHDAVNSTDMVVIQTGVSDCVIEATLTLAATANRIYFRTAGSTANYLGVDFYGAGGALRLFKPGTVIATSTVTRQIGDTVNIRLLVKGDQIRVFLDGTLSMTHTLSGADYATFGALTHHGFGSAGAPAGLTLDNFKVRSLQPTTDLAAAVDTFSRSTAAEIVDLPVKKVGLTLAGATGDFAYAPSPIKDSFSNGIDIRAELSVSWLHTDYNTIVGKWGTEKAFVLWVQKDTKKLRLYLSDDGTTSSNVQSTVAVPFSGSEKGFVRATWTPESKHAIFYTSYDGLIWTRLGDPMLLDKTRIHNSTDRITIGAYGYAGDGEPTIGTIYNVELRNGINGPVIFSPKFFNQKVLTQKFNDAQNNLWTVNGTGARIEGGTKLRVPGPTVNGNGASSGPSAALKPAGDLDIRIKLNSLIPWRSAPASTCIMGNNGFYVYPHSGGGTGYWQVAFRKSGGSYDYATAGANPQYTNTEIRITREVSTGTVRFYEKRNGDWAQFSSTSITPGPIDYNGVNNQLTVGATHSNTAPWGGEIYEVEVRSGIDGEIVASPDFTNLEIGQTSFTDEQGNVWVVNSSGINGARVVGENTLRLSPNNSNIAQTLNSGTFDGADFEVEATNVFAEDLNTAYVIASHYGASAGNRRWIFRIESWGGLGLLQWNSGESLNHKTTPGGFINAKTLYSSLKVVRSGTSLYFYVNGVLIHTDTAEPTAPISTTAPLRVGEGESGQLAHFPGRIGKLTYKVNGTIVASPDFTKQNPGVTSFTDAQGNSWTINQAHGSIGSTETGEAPALSWSVENSGIARLANGKLWFAEVSGYDRYAGVDTGLADFDMSIDVDSAGTDNYRGLMFARHPSIGNTFLALQLTNSALFIKKRDSGAGSVLVSSSTTIASDGGASRVRLVKVGDRLWGYVNGVLTLTHTFSAADMTLYGSSTIHGASVYSSATSSVVRQDNFRISRPPLVAVWPDLSGKHRHAVQTVTAKQPVALDNIKNGRSVVRFDGVDDVLDRDQTPVLAQPNTVLITSSVPSGGGNYYVFDGRSGNRNSLYFVPGSNSFSIYGGGPLGSSDVVTSGQWAQIAGIFDGVESKARVNGQTTVSGDAGNHGLGSYRIGSLFSSAGWFPGDIGAIIVSGGNLETTKELIAAEKHLTRKWT